MGDVGLIAGSGRSPGEGNGNPLLHSCVGNPMDHGQRSLVGYSPWGYKESDMTEHEPHMDIQDCFPVRYPFYQNVK